MRMHFVLALSALSIGLISIPVAVGARDGGGHNSHHPSDISVTKTTDKSSPTMMQRTVPNDQGLRNKSKTYNKREKFIDDYVRQ